MADKTVGELPQVSELYDDSLLVAEQQGEAVSVRSSVLKNYAKEGVNAFVTAAQDAAAKAEQAAKEAEEAASKIQDVSDDAEAAIAAAKAAENARAAAVSAQQAAEQAAALAAEQAASDVETKLQGYVTDAEQAKKDAQNAAENTASGVEEKLKGYVTDAENAKNAAQTAAENAANETVQSVETQLQGYVTDAENAKNDAQNAAGSAATDAANSVSAQLSNYVSAAQAAQKAAEQARDEAQAIAGGDFLPLSGGIMTGVLESRTHTKTLRNPDFNYPLSTGDNVAELNLIGSAGSTGTICITLSDANHFFDIDFSLMSYTHVMNVMLSGGTYYEGASMIVPGAIGMCGTNIPKIRTATDANGRRCWLIGEVDTNWGGWCHAVISRMTAVRMAGQTTDPLDIAMSLVTDETGYTIHGEVTVGNDAIRKSGGTMTGPLTLFGAPTEDLHAATKKYVDDQIGDIGTILDSINGEVV